VNKPGRNDPCPCGSGKKYKRCHWDQDQRRTGRERSFLIGYRVPFEGVTTLPDGQVLVDLPSGEKVKPDHVFSQTHYPRASGKDKVIDRVHGVAVSELAGRR
jgi:hypothetical protein